MDIWEKPVFESKEIAGVLSSRVDGRCVNEVIACLWIWGLAA
jgi:hypothetical protein